MVVRLSWILGNSLLRYHLETFCLHAVIVNGAMKLSNGSHMKCLFFSFTWKIVLYLVWQFVHCCFKRPHEKRFQESLEERDVIWYFCNRSPETKLIYSIFVWCSCTVTADNNYMTHISPRKSLRLSSLAP